MHHSPVKKPVLYAISGYKNTGKTTLIQTLIPKLTSRGLKVATIKHDGHDFTPDIPGTDTYRHAQSGAYGTAIYSSNRLMITKTTQTATAEELAAYFPEADVILLEGFKNSQYPKYFINRENGYVQEAQINQITEEILHLVKKNKR